MKQYHRYFDDALNLGRDHPTQIEYQFRKKLAGSESDTDQKLTQLLDNHDEMIDSAMRMVNALRRRKLLWLHAASHPDRSDKLAELIRKSKEVEVL